MNTKNQPARPGHRVWTGLLLSLVVVAPMAAQSRLYVLEPDDKYHAVIKVSGSLPFIMANGRPTAATGKTFALIKAEDCSPLFITVRDRQARTAAVILNDDDRFNRCEFQFSASFEADSPMEDVFLALEVEFSNVGKSIFVHEVGRLEPQKPESLSVRLPLERNLHLEQMKLHLFAGGTEVLHSELSAAERDALLDRMVSRRIATVRNAAPRPFFGAAPEYPPALRTTGTRGEAVVTMRITPRGTVQEPVVERATDPAFGAAALAAARQWRFLPQVENGKPVETRVSMPVAFDLPNPPEKN